MNPAKSVGLPESQESPSVGKPYAGMKIGNKASPWFFLYRLESFHRGWREWRLNVQSPSRDTGLERTSVGAFGSWGNEDPWVRCVVWLCKDGEWMRGKVAWVVPGKGFPVGEWVPTDPSKP